MKILLLNSHPIVAKLVRLSAAKLSYEFSEDAEGSADIIIIDESAKADVGELASRCRKLIILTDKPTNVDGAVKILHKPFLPTDLISLLVDDKIENEAPDTANADTAEVASVQADMNLDDLNFEKSEEKADLSGDEKEAADDVDLNGADVVEKKEETEFDKALSGLENFGDDGKEAVDLGALEKGEKVEAMGVSADNEKVDDNVYLQDFTGEKVESVATSNAAGENADDNVAKDGENADDKKDDGFQSISFDDEIKLDPVPSTAELDSALDEAVKNFDFADSQNEGVENADLKAENAENSVDENVGLKAENTESVATENAENLAENVDLNAENSVNLNENLSDTENPANLDKENLLSDAEKEALSKVLDGVDDAENPSNEDENVAKLNNANESVENADLKAGENVENPVNLNENLSENIENSQNLEEKNSQDESVQDLGENEATQNAENPINLNENLVENAENSQTQQDENPQNDAQNEVIFDENDIKDIVSALEPENADLNAQNAENPVNLNENAENLQTSEQNANAQNTDFEVPEFLNPLQDKEKSVNLKDFDENVENENAQDENPPLNENVENENPQAENAEDLANENLPSVDEISQENVGEAVQESGENAQENTQENAAKSDEIAPSVVEKIDTAKMSFDDLPQDASFLGDKDGKDSAEIEPELVEEGLNDDVKAQLADLSDMDALQDSTQSVENAGILTENPVNLAENLAKNETENADLNVANLDENVDLNETQNSVNLNDDLSENDLAKSPENETNLVENKAEDVAETANLSDADESLASVASLSENADEKLGENADLRAENSQPNDDEGFEVIEKTQDKNFDLKQAILSDLQEIDADEKGVEKSADLTENVAENSINLAQNEAESGENLATQGAENPVNLSNLNSDNEAKTADFNDDFSTLSQRELQIALGETPTELTDDLSQSEEVSQKPAILSQDGLSFSKNLLGEISSQTLRAALKGMKMHIDINIKFDDEKA